MLKKYSVVLFIFLLLLPLVTAFEFTELMPNPTGDDNNQEFVELFTDKNYNFSNTTFIIVDEASNDTLEFLTSFGNSSQSFFLIVEEAFDYSPINESALFENNVSCHIFSVGATIGNNLANEGETLAFFFDNQSINTSYVVVGCADGEGCSLVARNNSWSPEVPSPCAFSDEIEEINITHNESNVTSGPCVANFSIQAENIFVGGETVTYKPLLVTDHDTFSYEISYWWEDLHGKVVKDARSTNNIDEKRYTPNVPEHETDKAFFIRMRALLNCTEEIFSAEKIVVLSGEEDAVCDEIEEKTCENSGSSGGGVACTKYAVLTLTTPKETNEHFLVALTLHNNDFLEYEYRVYAYAYRGSKSYSGEREHNAKTIKLKAHEQQTILLPLSFIDAEPGEYSVKALAERTGRKTPFEARGTIQLIEEKKNIQVNNTVIAPAPEKTDAQVTENLITAGVVAENEPKNNIFFSAWPAILVAGGLYGLSRLLSRRKVFKDSSSLKSHVWIQEKEACSKEKASKKGKKTKKSLSKGKSC